MKLIARRLMAVALILGGLVVTGIGARYEVKRRAYEQARKGREARYEETLRSYAQELKPGMNRKEVEDYLRKKNVPVMRMCCVDSTEMSIRKSMDDLTRIGEEDAPWYCGEYNVYVAFQFEDHGEHGLGKGANDLDTLKAVRTYRWLERCL